MRRLIFALVFALALAPASSEAQGFGLAARASTTGVGGEVAISLLPRINLRAGLGFIPVEPDFTFSDIDYTISFPSPQVLAVVDLFPLGGTFRLSGGVLVQAEDIDADGQLAREASVRIGDETFDRDDVGNLKGTITTRDVAPYVGIGWGNHASAGVGLFLDLGVAFQEDPGVRLEADGPIRDNAVFQENLERERRRAEDDVGTFFEVYPVVTFGLRFGVGP